MFEVINKKECIKRTFNSKDEALDFIDERIYDFRKTNKILCDLEDFEIIKNGDD